MIAHKQQHLAKHLNFNRSMEDPEGVNYTAWAEGIKGSHNPAGAWTRSSPRSFSKLGGDIHDDEFKLVVKEEEEEDVESPRLWDKIPHSPTNQLRAQLIANYRQEMMEAMVTVPESAYELSLQDLVEVMPRKEKQGIIVVTGSYETTPSREEGEISQKTVVKEEGKRRGIGRSKSVDAGSFLLKMFMPFSVSERKKKKNSHEKMLQTPEAMADGGRRRWWSDSRSSRGSSSHSSSGSSSSIVSSERKPRGCYSFFCTTPKNRRH